MYTHGGRRAPAATADAQARGMPRPPGFFCLFFLFHFHVALSFKCFSHSLCFVLFLFRPPGFRCLVQHRTYFFLIPFLSCSFSSLSLFLSVHP